MSSSVEGPQLFDPQAAAQQMLDLEAAEPPSPSPRLPAQGFANASGQPPGAPSPAAGPADGSVHSASLMPPSLSDRGNARLFVQLYRDQFRHVEGLGWFAWDGYRWKRAGGEKAALWAAGEMAEDMPVSDPRGVFGVRDLVQHRRRTLSTTGLKALLTQAKASPDISVDPDALDGDPYVLCTPGGVIDLRDGGLRVADPVRDL
ncbi:DNA primase, partial [Streptomyces sp. NPDC006654]